MNKDYKNETPKEIYPPVFCEINCQKAETIGFRSFGQVLYGLNKDN